MTSVVMTTSPTTCASPNAAKQLSPTQTQSMDIESLPAEEGNLVIGEGKGQRGGVDQEDTEEGGLEERNMAESYEKQEQDNRSG